MHNLYVQQRVGFVCLACFVLALSLIWKEKNNSEFSDFCRFVMFRGDFLKQLGQPRINAIRGICPRTHAEYKIIPLVDKNISVNVRSCEVLGESKCNLAASILWAEHCHLQGHSVVTTALFQYVLCCSHGDRCGKNLNGWGGTFTDSRYKIYNSNTLSSAAVGAPVFFAGVRRINHLNLQGKKLK